MSKIYSFLALFAACTADEINVTSDEFTDSEGLIKNVNKTS
ncbi:hypothetical protein C900_01846 [Fulvivirga imtechensis AK7]|uniref:Uncharacterized protein n=1 Tax=Fulvivirga imtechensis AK7 TaxID=1237149 RepID=L8JWU7_9BACT|nr:hypothetical protein [Fulvivirga imtechensis]ELR72104.1 hypothetical protein C900_01846 [Fulvivirga imtechensis AK7]